MFRLYSWDLVSFPLYYIHVVTMNAKNIKYNFLFYGIRAFLCICSSTSLVSSYSHVQYLISRSLLFNILINTGCILCVFPSFNFFKSQLKIFWIKVIFYRTFFNMNFLFYVVCVIRD